MFSCLVALCIILSFSTTVFASDGGGSSSGGSTYVHGYYRKDGTYVHGYTRSSSHSSATYSTYKSPYRYEYSKTVNLYKGSNVVDSKESSKLVYVQGYYNKDGRYVRPHYRTYPDCYLNNNFSYLGKSSLMPLPSDYTYSKSKSIKTTEKYLLHNINMYNGCLYKSQYANLKKYAETLNSSLDKNHKVAGGCKFYNEIGFNSDISSHLANFDVTGTITPEQYLFFTAYNEQYDPLFDWKKEVYSTLLDMYSRQEVDEYYIRGFAMFLYLDYFESYEELTKQIDLDLLQTFSSDNERYTKSADMRDKIESAVISNFPDCFNSSQFESYDFEYEYGASPSDFRTALTCTSLQSRTYDSIKMYYIREMSFTENEADNAAKEVLLSALFNNIEGINERIMSSFK